jgi:hypothetical protein
MGGKLEQIAKKNSKEAILGTFKKLLLEVAVEVAEVEVAVEVVEVAAAAAAPAPAPPAGLEV